MMILRKTLRGCLDDAFSFVSLFHDTMSAGYMSDIIAVCSRKMQGVLTALWARNVKDFLLNPVFN